MQSITRFAAIALVVHIVTPAYSVNQNQEIITYKKICIDGKSMNGNCSEGDGSGRLNFDDFGEGGNSHNIRDAINEKKKARNENRKLNEEIKREIEDLKKENKNLIKLGKNDLKLLSEISKLENLNKYMKILLATGTTSSLIFSNLDLESQIEFTVNLTKMDFDGLSKAISASNKITMCTISDKIRIYIDESPESILFWEKLFDLYDKAC